MKKLSLLKILILYFVVSSLLLTFIIPPFQKTDEVSHYYKTIAVATGNFFCRQDDGGQPYTYLPESYAKLSATLLADFTNQSPTNRFPISTFITALKDPGSTQQYVKDTISCSLPIVLYLPVAAILSIPIQLHIPPLVVFYLGRLSFLILGYALIALALKIVPKQYRVLLMGYLILPMVSVQLGSFNKEVLHLAAGASIFATYMKLRQQFSKKLLILLALSLYVVVLSRPFYAPLFILIPLTLPKRTVKYFVACLLAMLSIFLLYLPKLTLFHNGTLNSEGVSAALQLEFLHQYPQHFLTVIWNSYTNHITAYAKSLIGTYGSIHYYLDWYVYVFFGAWLLFLCLRYREALPKFTTKEVVGISAAMIAIVLSSFLLFYLYATPVAFQYVIDVQGRYFINLLPFLILLVATLLKKHPQGTLVVALSIALLFLVKSTFNRYYDYSAGYVYEDREKLVHLVEQPNLKSWEIIQSITQTIAINPTKKLKGVSLIVVNDKKHLTQPLQVEFYEEGCQKLISKTMMMNHLQKTTAAIDVPVHATAKAQLCVKISPFSTPALNAKPERLALDQNSNEESLFMMPYYAY